MTGRRWAEVRAVIGVVIALSTWPSGAATQEEWSWPERGENLQVLPADFPGSRIGAVMRGFSSALGVRCSHCHVGEEGQPLSTFDFASDANPNKGTARVMYEMLGAVNDHLDRIEPTGEEVNMWCHTCHNGKPRPQTLDEAVLERYRAGGSDAAIAYFLELRSRFYGGRQYDFTPGNVGQVGVMLVQEGDTATASRLFELNLEQNPESWEALEGMGDIARVTGVPEAAATYYERALMLSPGNPRIAAKLEGLRGG